MSTDKLLRKHIGLWLVLFSFSVIFTTQTVQADEDFNFKSSQSFKILTFAEQVRTHGFQISKRISLGKVRAAGKSRLGIIVNIKKYAFGVSNRGISFTKQF